MVSQVCCASVALATVLAVGLLPAAKAQIAPRQNDLVDQASAARMQNDIPRAITLYSQAVERNPKWADGWWFLGSLQYETGAYPSARDALSHYINMVPNAAPAFALRGLCEFETREYPQALTDIQHGLSLGAANQERNEQILRYHEAMLETRLGNYAKALSAYTYFAKSGLTNPELLVGLGLAGLRMPILPSEVSADARPLVSGAGEAAYQFLAGDEISAAKAFQELAGRFPSAPNIHFLYGYLLFANDPDAALTEFLEELKVARTNVDAQVMTAWALLLRNRAGEALPYAQAAADIKPDLPSAQLVFGRSLLETGDLDQSLKHLEEALKLEPNNLETHLALAKAYSKSGRNEDARRERALCLQITSTSDTTIERP